MITDLRDPAPNARPNSVHDFRGDAGGLQGIVGKREEKKETERKSEGTGQLTTQTLEHHYCF